MSEDSAPAADGGLDPRTAALAALVLDVGRHVGPEALDAPRWFALVDTADLLVSQPAFAAVIDDAGREAAAADPHHLTAIELEDRPAAADPLAALGEVSWPDIATGAALACDLPDVRPADGSADVARTRLGSGAVRAVVAARADGSTWCSVSGRGRRDQALGPRLLPELADALAQSVEDLLPRR